MRLVFDVRDDRYVAVRELRRAARGGVNVKNARLERLLDRDDVDGDTEALAADSGVTKAVEQLLGLSFEHFTSCVVLPQGDFAEFLHAKPGDRQAILTRLLGLGVYERIAREANREASAAGDRAALLAEQLGAYADATDEAVAEADRRVLALEALTERVAVLLPEVSAAVEAVAGADTAVATLRAEQGRLSALAPPAGLDALEGRRREADDGVRLARARFCEAEAADDAARALLAAAPERGPLERVRRDHADLAAALAARPAAVEALAAARSAEEKAARQAEEAEEAATAAVAARESAAASLTVARTALGRLADERALLAAVHPPAGLDAVQRRRTAAAAALEAAGERLAAAEAADATARERLVGAPERGPLEQARRDHEVLATARVAEPAAAARLAAATRTRAEAADAVAAARAALAAALGRRDAAARGDLAAALRPSLVVGEPCPVCTQHVPALPPPLPGADVAALEAAVARAQAGLERALANEADAVAAERHVAGERDRLTAEITRLQAAVAAANRAIDGSWSPAGVSRAGADGATRTDHVRGGASATTREERLDSVEAVEAVLTELDALAAAAAAADDAARAARRTRDQAAAEAATIQRELASAASALRAARDPLVSLGAPGTADDPAAGWSALVEWAAQARVEREAALPDAERAAATAGATADDAVRTADAAGAEVVARRREATAAARTEQQARGRVEALDERVTALRAALIGAPSPEQADAELARRDELEESARAADAALRRARSACSAADDASDDVRREVAAGWEALRGARDPLVGLGAPAVLGDDLAAAWSALASWAHREAAERAARLPAAVAAAASARSTQRAVHSRLGAALAAEGVAAVGGAPIAVDARWADADARNGGCRGRARRRLRRGGGGGRGVGACARRGRPRPAHRAADGGRGQAGGAGRGGGDAARRADARRAAPVRPIPALAGGLRARHPRRRRLRRARGAVGRPVRAHSRRGRVPRGRPRRRGRAPPGEDAVGRRDVPGQPGPGARALGADVDACRRGRGPARLDLPRRGVRDAGRGEPGRGGEHAGEPGRPRRPDGRRHHSRPEPGRAGAGAVRGASRPAVGAYRTRGQLRVTLGRPGSMRAVSAHHF